MKVLSLFSGIGGFDEAFQRKGHKIIGACEINKYARQVYARHFPKIPIHPDATKINPEELPDFDILVAGFPCQSFSIAGRRKGFEDTRGTLFFEIARIAQEKRPRHLLLENVKGLLSHESGDTIRKIYKTLDELGYDTESHIINTKDFLPQNRERIFIVGTLRGERRREIFPIREDIERNNSTRHQTQKVGSRIQDKVAGSIQTSPSKGTSTMIVGAIDANYHKGYGSRTMIATPQIDLIRLNNQNPDCNGIPIKSDISYTLTTKGGKEFGIVEQKLNCLVDGGHDTRRIYGADGIARTLRANSGGMGSKTGLYAMLTERRTEKAKEIRRQSQKQGGRDFSPRREKELVPRNDALANCLTSSQGMEGFLSNGKKVRRLTPTECERLQGFPDGYTEPLSDTQKYKCLGNAVTVPVVEYILERLE